MIMSMSRLFVCCLGVLRAPAAPCAGPGAVGTDRRSRAACASSHPAAIDAAMLPKRPLDSQKPNGTRRISASPSRMLSCQRVTRNSGSPTHTHTHTSEAKLGTPPLSHMISVSCVLWSERHMLWSHTPPSSALTFAAPRTEHPWSPFLFPDGLPTYNFHPLFQMAMGRARQRAALTLSRLAFGARELLSKG